VPVQRSLWQLRTRSSGLLTALGLRCLITYGVCSQKLQSTLSLPPRTSHTICVREWTSPQRIQHEPRITASSACTIHGLCMHHC
jgi:hypothetical protein